MGDRGICYVMSGFYLTRLCLDSVVCLASMLRLTRLGLDILCLTRLYLSGLHLIRMCLYSILFWTKLC